jgi:GntR family transcriptional repressor for pyruvate dehydrogenase complex
MDKNRNIGTLSRPLARGSVVKMVLERIREAIINRELKPGDYLPSEAELTSSLGVGKTSVREAIKMLEAMGVVEVRQGHGTFIREHASEDSIGPLIFQLILEQATPEGLLELRLIFEPAYTLLAMRKATEEDIKRIRECLELFEKKIREKTQMAEDDLEFHRLILTCVRNPFIERIGLTMHQLFKKSIEFSMVKIPDVALKDHKAIFEAFSKKDEAALRQAILKSYDGWKIALGLQKSNG